MSEKTEALRLASRLESDFICSQTMEDAAAELRRLHEENEAIHQAITDPENQPSQFGTVTFAMYEALEAQRDALLEALKLARPYISTYALDGYHAEVKADAVIKAVEGEKA